MNRLFVAVVALALASGCGDSGTATLSKPKGTAAPAATTTATAKTSLVEARRGFTTQLGKPEPPREAVPQPPAEVFQLIKYPSPVGDLAAYLTPDPGDGQKHPAIVWITGGDSNAIGELWEPAPRDNDQTAAAYRQAGIVLMFPSLRGGNDNPGHREGFLGEVDDVLAATDYLAKQTYVDASRIYLGGHSTGGTLAMLVAEISDRYRATFAFGPAGDVRAYGGQFVYNQSNDPKEFTLRSPGYWLESVHTPLFVIEGTDGNIESLKGMKSMTSNPQVHFVAVPNVGHFAILSPANEAIAAKILADTGPTSGISITEQELQKP